MAGDHPHLRGRHGLNHALYDIVANGMNGIDVDKCAAAAAPALSHPLPGGTRGPSASCTAPLGEAWIRDSRAVVSLIRPDSEKQQRQQAPEAQRRPGRGGGAVAAGRAGWTT